MKQVNFKVAFIKSVASFSTGKLISNNDYRNIAYWKGSDEVRETKTKNYLVVAGSDSYGNSQGYAEFVFEILNAPNGFNIEGLNYHTVFEMSSFRKNEVCTVTFSSESLRQF